MWVVIQCRVQCSLRRTPITLTSLPILQCKEVLLICRVGRVRMQCQLVLLTFRLFLMCKESLIKRSRRVLMECAVHIKWKAVLIVCRVGRVLIECEMVLLTFRAGHRILREFKAVTCREVPIYREGLNNCKQVFVQCMIQLLNTCKQVLMQCIQLLRNCKQVLIKFRVLMKFEATLIKFSRGVIKPIICKESLINCSRKALMQCTVLLECTVHIQCKGVLILARVRRVLIECEVVLTFMAFLHQCKVNCKVPITYQAECKVLVRSPHIMQPHTTHCLRLAIRFTRLIKQMTCKCLRVVPCKQLRMVSTVWA